MTKACVLLADGFEEIEAVTIIDVLRRAEIDTTVLGVEGAMATGSHGIAVKTDALLADRAGEPWDVVVLPGGMPGAAKLRDTALVQRFVVEKKEQGAILGAICAAPIALGRAGLLQGRRATCYPGFEAELSGAIHTTEPVVIDRDVLTSRGPGTALRFALALVERIRGREAAAALGERMLHG